MNKEKMYDTILSPVVTEKSTLNSEYNQVTFKVAIGATKPDIKAAVEGLFGVTVTSVNTMRMKGKVKRFRGQLGKRSDWKKAVITLKDGDSIDLTTGI